MERTILHCDCNGFFASVECILNPALATVPMAVAGNPENRHGIILAKNELAKKYNVVTAETIWQAKRKCPDLVLVPPHHGEYEKYSRLINNIYEEFTDLVEPFGIDESWLDVTGVQHLFGDGRAIADKLRDTVRERLGLTISVGVSFNKVFAKLGSDYKKPDATTVISRENFKDVVFPLPATDLLFVGKAAAAVLDKLYIKTIGELAAADKATIKSCLGKMGEMIWEYANGLDDSPVHSVDYRQDVKSISNNMTFRRNLIGPADIALGVNALADEVAYRMRKSGLKCNVVGVIIKDPSLKSISRQKTLQNPTHLSKDIAQAAIELIQASWSMKAPIRMLSVAGTNLVDADSAVQQLSLFGEVDGPNRVKQEKLETAMDRIRDKYGKGAIGKAGTIKNDIGIP
ncbi:MAG: DNA polymerase IV [Angelakisella sp.]